MKRYLKDTTVRLEGSDFPSQTFEIKYTFQFLKAAQSKREFSFDLKSNNDGRSLILKSGSISVLE